MVQSDSMTAGQVLARMVGAMATEAEDYSLLLLFLLFCSHPVSVLCLVFCVFYSVFLL